jgi:uncharacterized protein
VAYTDFYGCLCDVHPDGKSINICEGLARLRPETAPPASDGVICVTIDLWATAYQFQEGHNIRLQISSGAHPRWGRNLGTGDLIGTAMQSAHQTVYHDADHPSVLQLPVTMGTLG